jgi:hypothetical protein
MALIRRLSAGPITVFRTWKELSRNHIISVVNRLVVGLTAASIAVIAWFWRFLPPLVPLWYSRPWGEDRLATPAWLFVLPAGALVWYAVSIIIATYVTREYLTFTQILLLTTLLGAILSFVTLVKILFLVT